ncbi:ketose-bisphosphate aldolase, partial [Patescibacteria group bacterium]|nr:ketose-bisphosphate aldolase [Patescibacteria group bacterium]
MSSSLSNWLQKARQDGFGIGAFNAANLEVVKGIVAAAEAQMSPVIIEASQGQAEYFGLKNFVELVHNYASEKKLPIFANLDHGKDIKLVQQAIEYRFDMVHFDGSDLPIKENLNASAQLVQLAHQHGVLLEVEFDKIQRSSELYEETAQEVQIQGQITDPQQAQEQMEKVKADLLAVSIGNLHGVYQTEEEINLILLAELGKRLDCFLTLHGGSGINADQIKQAVGGGVQKINVNTQLRLAYRESLEKMLASTQEVKIYKLMLPVIGAVQKVVEEKMKLFGSTGRVDLTDQTDEGLEAQVAQIPR